VYVFSLQIDVTIVGMWVTTHDWSADLLLVVFLYEAIGRDGATASERGAARRTAPRQLCQHTQIRLQQTIRPHTASGYSTLNIETVNTPSIGLQRTVY